jgi:ferric iron reductase protein FhuF
MSLSERLFAGRLAVFAPTLAADGGMTLEEFLQPDGLEQRLRSIYGDALFENQRDVLVSQYSKYYFMALLPAVLVATLVHGWRLPLAGLRVVLDERGLPGAIQLVGEGEPGTLNKCFADLVERHLPPVIHTLADFGQVAPAVLWGNVGDYVESTLQTLAELTDTDLSFGFAQLRDPSSPLYNAISYKPRRQRQTCCLAHEVEGIGHCEHCPLA